MLYAVGFGPGDQKHMTIEAAGALEKADVIVGYQGYTELIRPLYPEKEYVSTGMKSEIERCEKAIDLAENGLDVAVVCSGDAGVYGMAGLLIEILEKKQLTETVEFTVVAGVTAALSAAALFGAPLGHDLALISLSDLMTPWELIRKRLIAVAQADFCIALYNPSSRSRGEHFKEACRLLLEHIGADTPCGIADRIGRDGERTRIVKLFALAEEEISMQSIVLIGNSKTRRVGAMLVTPRGYLEKYE